MQHVVRISKKTTPRYAAPIASSKDGCKANVSGAETLACKMSVKRYGSYPNPL